jgi:predicted nuclease with TOPRIM domain
MKISGNKENLLKDSLDRTLKDEKEIVIENIKSIKIEIELLDKSIKSLTNNCGGLKIELKSLLEKYLSNKNEKFDDLIFT